MDLPTLNEQIEFGPGLIGTVKYVTNDSGLVFFVLEYDGKFAACYTESPKDSYKDSFLFIDEESPWCNRFDGAVWMIRQALELEGI